MDDVSPDTLTPTSTAPIATARALIGGAAGPVAGELLAHPDDEHPVLSALLARNGSSPPRGSPATAPPGPGMRRR
ncbi:MAG: hypothetical protein LC799_32600 [Actinobacteria bacterium]|nr:hypothetical protein [Actinomycetota bacterium]